jgi:hypothetical protein
VVLGHLIATLGVVAKVAVLEAAAEEEKASILQQSERVGSVG